MVDVIAGLLVIFASVLLNIDFFRLLFSQQPSVSRKYIIFFSSLWFYVILGALLLAVVLMVTVFKNTPFMAKVKKFSTQ